jgi:integrase
MSKSPRDRLSYNPSERIDLPAPGSGRPKRIASASEAAELLDALDVRDRPIWATAFYAGMRRGEIQALRVGDVDLDTNVIRRRAGVGSGGGGDRSEVARRIADGAAARSAARLPE